QTGKRVRPDCQLTGCSLLAEHKFPVVVTHRDEDTIVIEVIELVSRSLRLLSGEIWQLIVAVEVNLEGLAAYIGTLEQLVLDIGVAGCRKQRWKPIKAGDDLIRDFTFFDMARPADHGRHPERSFPIRIFLTAERRSCRVRPSKHVWSVVGCVNHDG